MALKYVCMFETIHSNECARLSSSHLWSKKRKKKKKKKSCLEYTNCLIIIIDMMTRDSFNLTVC